MVRLVYSVYDSLSGFMGPVCDLNDDVAVRNFTYMVKNSKEYTANARDYSLYRIGEFDDEKGMLDSIVPPILLCRAEDFLST